MSIPVDQPHKRVPKIDEDLTSLATDVAKIAKTQRSHSDTLDRHTAYHKDHEVELRGIRLIVSSTKAQLEGKFSRMEDEFGQLRTDVEILKTDVSELKTDVSELKTDMSEVKSTLAEILTRLPVAA